MTLDFPFNSFEPLLFYFRCESFPRSRYIRIPCMFTAYYQGTTSDSFNKFSLLTFLPIFLLQPPSCLLSPFTTLAERFPKWIGITQQVSFPIHPGRHRFPYHFHDFSSSTCSPRTPTSNTCHFPSSRSIPHPQSFAPLQLDRVCLNGYNAPHPLALFSQTPSISWTVKHEGDKKNRREKLGEKLSMSGKLILTSFYWEMRFIRHTRHWNVVVGNQLSGTALDFRPKISGVCRWRLCSE